MRFPAASLRAFRHRNYRLWAGADIVSVTGTWMQVLGVNWLILKATGSATSVGLSLVLTALPTMILGMWGGSLADRLPSRPVVVASQIAQAALAATLAMIALKDPGNITAVYGVALAGGVVTALGGPALGRFGAEVVPPEDLPNALSLGSVLNSAGRILGMSLAGVLMPVAGMPGLFMINAVSFFAVLAALAMMRRSEMYVLERASGESRGIRAGVAFVLRTPWLLTIFGLALVLGSMGRNYQVTMASMSAGPLAAGAGGYALLSTVFAVGTVIGGIAAAGRPQLTMRLLLATAIVTSLAQAFSGVMPVLSLFAMVMLPIAAGGVVIDTTIGSRIQLDTPEKMRGRILAVNGIVGAAAGAIGGPVLGWMCDNLGPRNALEISGLITAGAALLAAVALARINGVSVAGLLGLPSLPVRRVAAAVEEI
ncbi:MFS transporter [Bailinhaonella thermotolerans]|uniref:MFS transporter n=1 Tax=Bailinhaonella thermotolerans TaxID=1070861 RepID=UPI00192A322D|nr:MFS transporter [Bailinhaonella thermotolerans]